MSFLTRIIPYFSFELVILYVVELVLTFCLGTKSNKKSRIPKLAGRRAQRSNSRNSVIHQSSESGQKINFDRFLMFLIFWMSHALK